MVALAAPLALCLFWRSLAAEVGWQVCWEWWPWLLLLLSASSAEVGKNTTSYLRFRSSISTQQVAYLNYTFFKGKIEGQRLLPSIFCKVGVDGAMFFKIDSVKIDS
jgi:hypothetical protein